MCDVQILTGSAILISGFITLKSGISAYHWQYIVSLAWFSCVTHLAGLTTIRAYLLQNPWRKTLRFGFMACVLVMLVVAMVPTAYFDWTYYGGQTISSYPNSPALCYFDTGRAKELRGRIPDNLRYEGDVPGLLKLRAGEQILVFSFCLLTFSFISKSINAFDILSELTHHRVRRPLRTLGHKIMMLLAPLNRLPSQATHRRKRWSCFIQTMAYKMIFQPALAVFLTLRLFVDLLGSMLIEVCDHTL
jgi:hypothetical protein